MSKIESLLDEGTKQKLAAVAAQVSDTDPAFIVRKASTEPNPPRTLTVADAIEIDPESEAMIDAGCVDCKAPMLLDPKLPEDADPEDAWKPRVPVCTPCGKIRARFAAINEQRNVEIIQRRTRIAQRQPRTTDGIDHPVTVTTAEYVHLDELSTEAPEAKKENPMYDLDNVQDATLGAATKKGMKAALAATLPKKRAKAKKAKAEADVKAVKSIKQRQKERKGMVFAAFVVDSSLTVPALDLSDGEVEDLNEMVSSALRAPYNSARFRLAGEAPLWPPSKADEDGYVPTTYQTLVAEHARLTALASAKAAEKKAKAKAPKIVAVLDDADEAVVAKKVKALRKVAPELTKAKAREIVLASL